MDSQTMTLSEDSFVARKIDIAIARQNRKRVPPILVRIITAPYSLCHENHLLTHDRLCWHSCRSNSWLSSICRLFFKVRARPTRFDNALDNFLGRIPVFSI